MQIKYQDSKKVIHGLSIIVDFEQPLKMLEALLIGVHSKYSTLIVSVAPEVISFGKPTTKSDIWQEFNLFCMTFIGLWVVWSKN